MVKYIRFAVLGAFFAPSPIYWLITALCAAVLIIVVYARDNVDLSDYTAAEQPYQVTVGFMIENGVAVPKRVYYTDKGVRIMIPARETSIVHRENDIYDAYSRIRRKDGTGYDYVAAILKRVSETEFKEIRTSCGRELDL